MGLKGKRSLSIEKGGFSSLGTTHIEALLKEAFKNLGFLVFTK